MIHLARVWSTHRIAEQRTRKDRIAHFSSCWHIGSASTLITIQARAREHDQEHAKVKWLQPEGSTVIVEWAPERLPLYRELGWTDDASVVRFLYASEQFLLTRAVETLHPELLEQAGEIVSEKLRDMRRQRESAAR